MNILYRPEDGVAADFIPFFWNGDYHLFYLKDYRDEAAQGKGTPWFHLVTRDFVRFEDWGEALPRGAENAQDLWVFTGSVLAHEGTFHIFYTGHNSLFQAQGRPVQAVMHAASPDLRTWTKDEDLLFFAPPGYEQDDWRDPFVFWNDEAQAFWMLLAARKPNGPVRHRGCVALAASADLRRWEVLPPFWSPDLYYTHECPDLFRIGAWWYLVYSTFSERHVTHYRMSRSLNGPWLAPANDSFDGRAYYAAKTAGDGQRRFIFGWLPSRVGEKDDGGWQWGGSLVVHEIVQDQDGTLSVRLPDTVNAAFTQTQPAVLRAVLGTWKTGGSSAAANAQSRFSAALAGEMPRTCLIEAEITLAPGTVSAGLLLRAAGDLDHYYQLRLEPGQQRMVFDRWPRPGDQPFMLERPLAMTPGIPVRLQVLVDDACVVAYANGDTALCCRLYNYRVGQWGLFAVEGQASFTDLKVKTRALDPASS